MCQRTRQDTTEDVLCIEELRSNTERELEFVNMIQYLPVSEATQIAIKQATESDVTLQELKTVIREAKFQEFANLYGFEHVTSSLTYAQSNGKAENAVKTAKSLLEKAAKAEQDPYLALLDWRNTPTETLNSSPVQRLFGRRTKTLLPTSNRLLKPKLPEEVDQKLKLQKAKQSLHYNKGAQEKECDCSLRSLSLERRWIGPKTE
ncbi:PREDICTED: uncharacterized protein LOC107329559 [Acropora digitifera]|uniref:uncharacterized protein LOC107329559 n=1 Tax=Acropora digitifera TaxID=70779 RepID=UPI00077A0EE3|nr:PREDICTED: uncharacterized protein LOC107329559 [Acropora digitifera]